MQTQTLSRMAIHTAGGNHAKFELRNDTSDGALVMGIIGGNEYHFDRLQGLSGWAIDIGAHIGIVTVALAVDNPDLRIVAVEALPENVELLRRNVVLNGLEDRVVVMERAAGSADEITVPITYGWASAVNQPDHYMRDNRYIGGMVGPNETSTTIICEAVSMTGVIDVIDEMMFGPWTDAGGPDETHPFHTPIVVEVLKIDCEGCEWHFLTSPELRRVKRIIGELHHGKSGGAAEFRALLEPTHDVTMDDSLVVATFEAVQR